MASSIGNVGHVARRSDRDRGKHQCGCEHDLNGERLEDLDLGSRVNPWRVVAHQIAEREREGGPDQLGGPVTNHVSRAEHARTSGTNCSSRGFGRNSTGLKPLYLQAMSAARNLTHFVALVSLAPAWLVAEKWATAAPSR